MFLHVHGVICIQCAGLEFQVWSKLKQDTVESKQGDSYIGCAHVDLSPLAYGLSQISGWYNILDFAGQIQGQLKVSHCLYKMTFSSSNLMGHAGQCHSQPKDQLPIQHASSSRTCKFVSLHLTDSPAS